MGLSSQFATRRSLISYLSGMIAGLFLLVAVSAAQTQQGGSLADAARQARAQKGQTAPATSQAQQIADQLSEDQNDANTIGGFKTYNAGAYKLWVPAPFTNAQDSAGTVLSGPRVGTTLPLVLVGNSLVLHFGDNDDAFRAAATQFARNYAQSANCTKTTIANHSAYQCNLAGGNLLGRAVSGNAVFLRDSSNIFPVFCVANTDSWARDTLNNAYASWQQKARARQILAQEDQYAREVWKKCETVFQSIHFIAGAAQPENEPTAKAKPGPVKPAATSTSGQAGTTVSASTATAQSRGSGQPSLADQAHQLYESPEQAQSVPLSPANSGAGNSVPAGFKIQPFNYCKRQFDCWNASVVVPADAQLVSSNCKQYVFEMKVQGSPFLLLAGPAGGEGCGDRSQTDPGQVRWNELAAPESRRAPGTFHLISSQQATLDGQPAIISQIGFRKGLTEWMGKRAEIDSNGVPLVVGCLAPREHFADGDTICSGLIGSLQLP